MTDAHFSALAGMNTVESLYAGHPWNSLKRPD